MEMLEANRSRIEVFIREYLKLRKIRMSVHFKISEGTELWVHNKDTDFNMTFHEDSIYITSVSKVIKNSKNAAVFGMHSELRKLISVITDIMSFKSNSGLTRKINKYLKYEELNTRVINPN